MEDRRWLAGPFEAFIALLDPEVVIRTDRWTVRGARVVASVALRCAARFGRYARPALVNGSPGLVAATTTEPVAVVAFTIDKGRIVAIDMLAEYAVSRAEQRYLPAHLLVFQSDDGRDTEVTVAIDTPNGESHPTSTGNADACHLLAGE